MISPEDLEIDSFINELIDSGELAGAELDHHKKHMIWLNSLSDEEKEKYDSMLEEETSHFTL